jgi:general stress protein YciG
MAKLTFEKRQEIGRKGGLATAAKHGREHFSAAGKLGSQVLKERYGREHFLKAAAASALARAPKAPRQSRKRNP